MVQARHPSIHPVVVASAPARNERGGSGGKYMDVLERMVDLSLYTEKQLR